MHFPYGRGMGRKEDICHIGPPLAPPPGLNFPPDGGVMLAGAQRWVYLYLLHINCQHPSFGHDREWVKSQKFISFRELGWTVCSTSPHTHTYENQSYWIKNMVRRLIIFKKCLWRCLCCTYFCCSIDGHTTSYVYLRGDSPKFHQ